MPKILPLADVADMDLYYRDLYRRNGIRNRNGCVSVSSSIEYDSIDFAKTDFVKDVNYRPLMVRLEIRNLIRCIRFPDLFKISIETPIAVYARFTDSEKV